jgi:hypothetical protein
MEEQKAIEAQKKRLIQSRRNQRLLEWVNNSKVVRVVLYPVSIIKRLVQLAKAIWKAA